MNIFNSILRKGRARSRDLPQDNGVEMIKKTPKAIDYCINSVRAFVRYLQAILSSAVTVTSHVQHIKMAANKCIGITVTAPYVGLRRDPSLVLKYRGLKTAIT